MTESIVNPGSAFEQRPDNKLWIFYEKSGGLRLRKVYVFAYTWYDARNGALTALAPLKSKDVEGSEVDLPEDILIDTGNMLVFTDKSGRFEVLETLQRMSGKEASRLCVLPKSDTLPVESDALLVKSPAEDSELLNSIREKLEQTKPVPRREPGSVLSDPGYAGVSPMSHVDTLEPDIEDNTEDVEDPGPGEVSVALNSDKEDNQAIAILLWCPYCHERHIDEGEFATKLHHTHACQNCGLVWRPAIQPTVGVMFLPGFKNEVPE